MQRTINNNTYNTATDEFIGSWYNGQTGIDSINAELYKNADNKYYLYICGGAATRFGRPVRGTDTWTECGHYIYPVASVMTAADSEAEYGDIDNLLRSAGEWQCVAAYNQLINRLDAPYLD